MRLPAVILSTGELERPVDVIYIHAAYIGGSAGAIAIAGPGNQPQMALNLFVSFICVARDTGETLIAQPQNIRFVLPADVTEAQKAAYYE